MFNAQATTLPATPTSAHAKPLLRGYLHAAAALAAVVCTILLAMASADDRPKQISLVIYGASSILLFGWSALYHLGNWTPRVRKYSSGLTTRTSSC